MPRPSTLPQQARQQQLEAAQGAAAIAAQRLVDAKERAALPPAELGFLAMRLSVARAALLRSGAVGAVGEGGEGEDAAERRRRLARELGRDFDKLLREAAGDPAEDEEEEVEGPELSRRATTGRSGRWARARTSPSTTTPTHPPRVRGGGGGVGGGARGGGRWPGGCDV